MFKVWVRPYWARQLEISIPYVTDDLVIEDNGLVQLSRNKFINIRYLDCILKEEIFIDDAEQSGAKASK